LGIIFSMIIFLLIALPYVVSSAAFPYISSDSKLLSSSSSDVAEVFSCCSCSDSVDDMVSWHHGGVQRGSIGATISSIVYLTPQ
jgi:hypothetical protein